MCNRSLNIHIYLYITILLAIIASPLPAFSQTEEEVDSILMQGELMEVVVKPREGVLKGRKALNTELITTRELTRAACCNLGESFATNPSVDVSYSDAATGARQIRLLGLSGTYVQMLTENVPNFRGAAGPYGLGYIPGPWMQSIQISKGASSVKNGYESVSGQINVEMKKPQLDPSLSLNGYADHRGRAELNFDGNLHLGDRWSGAILLHGENSFKSHDENGDGFVDIPAVRQFSVMNRWAFLSTHYVFQIAAKYLGERRRSGQDEHHATVNSPLPLYRINIDTHRWELFTKNAYIFDRENQGNVALILSGSLHNQDAEYGVKYYDVKQRELYASLMFERHWTDLHAISAGLSLNYDYFDRHYLLNPSSPLHSKENETVAGGYAQYTFDLDSRIIAMVGLRYDYSWVYGSIFTPRLHFRWNPTEGLSINASAGRGHRSPHPLEEYNYLLASSRRFIIEGKLPLESAWNFGAGISWSPASLQERLTLSGEYFFTTFRNQLCVNFDRDPHAVYIYGIHGNSRSHSLQLEVNAKILNDLSTTVAYRFTDSRTNFGFGMEQRPLVSRSKGLLTLGYTPRMGLWQFDATLSINGGGRMPTPYITDSGALSWAPTYRAYCMLNLQATRNFRHWSVYIGGENLTGYKQKNPIIDASNPWGENFDATMIYGPLHGAVVYVGFRYHLTKF